MMRGLSSSLAPLVGQTQPVHHTRPEVLVESTLNSGISRSIIVSPAADFSPRPRRQPWPVSKNWRTASAVTGTRQAYPTATSYSSLGRARAIMIATTAKLARISGTVTNGPSPPAGGVPPGCRPRGPLDALAMRISHLSVVTNAPGDSEVARSGNFEPLLLCGDATSDFHPVDFNANGGYGHIRG